MPSSDFKIKNRVDILPFDVKGIQSTSKKKKHGFKLFAKKTKKKPKANVQKSTTIAQPMPTFTDDTRPKHKLSGKAKKLAKLRLKNKAQTEKNNLLKEAERVKKMQGGNDTLLVYRQQLHGLGNLISDKELSKVVKMGTPIDVIQKRITTRFLVSIVAFIAGMLVGLMAKSIGGGAVAGTLFGGFFYIFDIQRVSMNFKRFQLERQMAFSQFVRLAASYLPEMNDGSNMFAVFKKILPRLEHKRDRKALEKLMIDMQPDPDDPTPWNNFAKAFSVSQRATLIMATIQKMYQGDTNPANIQALARDADNEVISQVDQIIRMKLHKFNNLTTKIMMTVAIPMIGFFSMFLLHEVRTMFNGMSNTQDLTDKK